MRAISMQHFSFAAGWPDAATEYTGRLSVEASDDLAAWHSLVGAAPIANLHASGQTLVANRVEFAPTKPNSGASHGSEPHPALN